MDKERSSLKDATWGSIANRLTACINDGDDPADVLAALTAVLAALAMSLGVSKELVQAQVGRAFDGIDGVRKETEDE